MELRLSPVLEEKLARLAAQQDRDSESLVAEAVERMVNSAADPAVTSIADAPVEEEEITAETAAALERARASLARGEGIAHEAMLREFGLKR